MRALGVFFLMGCLVAGCGDKAPPLRADPTPVPWNKLPPISGKGELPGGLVRIEAIDATTSDAALAPILATIEQARIAGLGATTDGARAYLAAEGRLARALVETRGFRVIALPITRAEAASACATQGELVRAVCAWSEGRPDPVRFIGVDARDPAADLAELRMTGAALETCSVDATSPYDAQDHDACMRALDGIATNDPTIKVARIGLRAWQTQRLYATSDPGRANDAREAAAAALLEAQIGDARAVVVANARSLYRRRDRALEPVPGSMSMGTALADNFGDGYAPIVFTGYDAPAPDAVEMLRALVYLDRAE
jgi:hypothetical protein